MEEDMTLASDITQCCHYLKRGETNRLLENSVIRYNAPVISKKEETTNRILENSESIVCPTTECDMISHHNTTASILMFIIVLQYCIVIHIHMHREIQMNPQLCIHMMTTMLP